MVLSETNDEYRGLVDEVGVKLGPAERSGRSAQSGVGKVELGDAGERLDVESGESSVRAVP